MISKQYLAGFIDGEGSISCYKRKDTRTAKGFTISSVLAIANTHEGVVEEIKSMGNFKVFYKENGKNAKKIYAMQMTDIAGIRKLLKEITRYLIVKKPQAELMIAYCNSRLKHLNNRYTEDEIKLAKQITSLNSRGIKSVGILGVIL
jgi:hypothetical protein